MAFQTMSGIPKVTSTANFYSNTNPLLQGRGIGGFTQPSALFGNGEQGAWWDFSDLDNMYQDPANPVLKAVLEGTVGFVADKRVQTRGPEIITDPMLRTPAAWLQSAGGATATTTIGVGRIVINSDGSNVGVTCLNTALDATKYYEVQIFINSCSGIFGVDNNGTILGKIDSSNGNGLQKFIIKPQVNGVMGLKRQTAGVLDFAYLSVRELVGNHLVQPTAGARPTLSKKYNVLTQTDGANINPGARWSVDSGGGSLVNGSYTIGTANAIQRIACFSIPVVVGNTYRLRGRIKPNGVKYVYINNSFIGAIFTLNTETLQVLGTAVVSKAADGYIDWYIDGVATANPSVIYYQAQQTFVGSDQVYAGDGVSGFAVDKIDIRLLADANLAIPQYQSVTSATVYDTLGFPAYLLFDGATKWMQSAAAIPFSGTAETNILGQSTLSGTLGCVYESSINSDANDGSFNLFRSSTNYVSGLRGTLANEAINATVLAAPDTSVVNHSIDLSQATPLTRDLVTVNGTQLVTTLNTGGTTTGPLTTQTVYLGCRAGASFFWSGRAFGLILRNAATNANDLAMTNKWMGSKCGLFF